MFKRKSKKAGIQTPEFRKPTPPPPPTSGSNAHKPNQNYVPPASVKKPCLYETPCGWCTKWDKKCDKKIGCDKQSSEIDFTQLLDDEGDPMKAEVIRQWNEVYKKSRKMMDDK